ncbi:MAG: 3D domain-containing protein [Clostridiales bacterium]|nr:3D domain-containing protein [Clostridiales bacterium]
MKKVKTYFSSLSGVKWKALFCAVVVSFASIASAVQLTSDDVNLISSSARNKKIILELSESYLSPSTTNNISVLNINRKLYAEDESEEIDLVEMFSAEVESEAEKTTVKAEETTVEKKEEATVAQTEAAAESTVNAVEALSETTELPSSDNGYSFSELGLTQMSDIPVPDSIRFDENGIPLEYSYKLSGKSTTYNMGTRTATGTYVHPGVVAVDPGIIPYGSKMYIVASDGSGYIYGYASAEDTGGFIYWDNGPIVDLYVSTTSDVYYWGNKPVTIYVF